MSIDPEPSAPEEDDPTADTLLRQLVAGIGPSAESAMQAIAAGGRYELAEIIGRGGFGVVYRARDKMLERTVALKLLKAPEPDVSERFLREARLQARVEHDNVCRVYDAGELGGAPYIAMEHVAGSTLNHACAELSLEEKVAVMHDVAEGVHAAHRIGLIHRDLKPGNIMLERSDRGLRPLVLDFGLARETAVPSQTITGQILGTPAYMSPEQARGETRRIDRRTDVYGLGATLYEVLCGSTPFSAVQLTDLLLKITRDEPDPIREKNPDLPRDLEAIVLRCLEKQPADRYDSARALAEDLRRYLDGEPVQARRSLVYRAGKLVRKHRGLAAAMVAVLATAAIGAQAYLRSRAEARAEAEVARRVSEIDTVMRLGHLQPLHDVRREKEIVRRHMKAVEEAAAELGSAADGPRNYALGRGHLALQDHEAARVELARAWDGGYRTAEVAFALGQALSARYEKALFAANRVQNATLREAALKDADQKFKQPALVALRSAREGSTETPAYLQALIAHYEGRAEDALAKAAEAYAAAPLLYEARALQGEVHFARGRKLQQSGDYPGALAAYATAGEAYGAAIDFARSDPALHELDCVRLEAVLEVLMRTGKADDAAAQRALAACDRAMRADPDRASAYVAAAVVHRRIGDQALTLGKDPSPALTQTATLSDRAIALAPDDIGGYREKGWACLLVAEQLFYSGRDMVASANCALESFGKALEKLPNDPATLLAIGRTHAGLGEMQNRKGLDPTASLDKAVVNYRAALENGPKFTGAYNNMGLVFKERGHFEAARGRDPTPYFEQAIQSYRSALEIDRRNGYAYANLGVGHMVLADYQALVGIDPTAALNAGIASSTTAIAINPMAVGAYYNLAQCRMLGARQERKQGLDPRPSLEGARQAIGEALARNPSRDVLLVLQAQIELDAADHALASRAEALSFVKRAAEAVDKGLAANPNSAELLETRAQVELMRAKVAGASEEIVGAGLAAVAKTLAVNPRAATVIAVRGELHLTGARGAAPAMRADRAARAVESFREAFEMNPLLAKRYEREMKEAETLAKK